LISPAHLNLGRIQSSTDDRVGRTVQRMLSLIGALVPRHAPKSKEYYQPLRLEPLHSTCRTTISLSCERHTSISAIVYVILSNLPISTGLVVQKDLDFPDGVPRYRGDVLRAYLF
jgi:hypothetical protein